MAVIFTGGHNAVVAHRAIAIDAGMIKVAIHVDIDETGRVVAVIAFNGRLDVVT